ncbi:MAG TPA: VOC family protein [Nocardioides sp.]|nr:VOC family protein [Nocardioides sp.]
MTGVRWVTAFLDTAEERADEAEVFWSRVTGYRVSPRRGRREEFATLLPPEGDAFLKVQRVVQSPPGGLHLDLHTDDVPGLAQKAEDLGATASYLEAGYVVCGSPGGLTFCVVGHPGESRPGPADWPGGRSLVDQVCLDIPPSRWDSEVAFWAALTGWERGRQSGEFGRLVRPEGQPLMFLLQRLDDEQPGVTAHLDLGSDDADAEAARHVALGATEVRRADGWITLLDPAGRPYCVTRHPVDRD